MDVSADFICTVTDEILPELQQWRNRPLESACPVVFLDAIQGRSGHADRRERGGEEFV